MLVAGEPRNLRGSGNTVVGTLPVGSVHAGVVAASTCLADGAGTANAVVGVPVPVSLVGAGWTQP